MANESSFDEFVRHSLCSRGMDPFLYWTGPAEDPIYVRLEDWADSMKKHHETKPRIPTDELATQSAREYLREQYAWTYANLYAEVPA